MTAFMLFIEYMTYLGLTFYGLLFLSFMLDKCLQGEEL